MRTFRWIRATAVMLLVAGVARAPASAQTIPTVDTDRLIADVAALANDSMSGRATGTPGAERARTFLVRRLEEIGLAPEGDSYREAFTWDGHAGVNLLAVAPGRDEASEGVIVVSAHYDHLGIRDGEIYNGADDDASGVAAVLEVGRQLSMMPLRHAALLAFFDAEEEGLQGSLAFVRDPPLPLDSIALDVNLDMVSRTYGVLWASGAYHFPALRPILEAVSEDAPLSLRLGHDRPGAPEGDDWTDSSDHGPFYRMGIPFVYFGVEDHPDYHQPTDDVERIDPDEFTTAVQTILMGLRALDAALPLPEPATR